MATKLKYTPQKRMSVSATQTFQQCPQKYKFAKLDKIPEPKTEEQLRGILVHEVLEELFKLSPDERTYDRAKEIAKAKWHEGWDIQVSWELDLSDQALKDFRWQVQWCIDEYFKLENPTELNPDGLETKIGFDWDKPAFEIAGVPFLGAVDRWTIVGDGEAEVVDYKTGKAPAEKYKADKAFQIMVYADLISQAFGLAVKRGHLIFLKAPGKIVTFEVDDDQMAEMRKTVRSVHNELLEACRTGVFETRPSRLCDWCNFKGICPAFNGAT